MEEHDNHHFAVFQPEAEVTDWFRWHKGLSVEKKARNLQFIQILAQQIEKLSKRHTELQANFILCYSAQAHTIEGKNDWKRNLKVSPR